MSYANLVIFTYNPPFGVVSESAFLSEELRYHLSNFTKVWVVPEVLGSTSSVCASFTLEYGLAKQLGCSEPRYLVVNSGLYLLEVWSEIFRSLKLDHNFVLRIKTILWMYSNAHKVSMWLEQFIKQNNIDLERTLFYSYWLGRTTLGIALTKQRFSGIKFVSRAHGVDLYDDRKRVGYLPFRSYIFRRINRLFLISDHGLRYISDRYPDFVHKYSVSRLGVKDCGCISSLSTDGSLRIVSCAYLRPVKRVHLLAISIAAFANLHPDKIIFWDHFGSGPEFDRLQQLAQNFSANVKACFWGNVSNSKIQEHYRINPVDIFISVSESEGVPVSIMEALSFGIPIISTNVGGVSEIVNSMNGILLKSDPTIKEVVEAIEWMVSHPDQIKAMKHKGRMTWENDYNADRNYSSFSQDLLSISLKSA